MSTFKREKNFFFLACKETREQPPSDSHRRKRRFFFQEKRSKSSAFFVCVLFLTWMEESIGRSKIEVGKILSLLEKLKLRVNFLQTKLLDSLEDMLSPHCAVSPLTLGSQPLRHLSFFLALLLDLAEEGNWSKRKLGDKNDGEDERKEGKKRRELGEQKERERRPREGGGRVLCGELKDREGTEDWLAEKEERREERSGERRERVRKKERSIRNGGRTWGEGSLASA